MSDLRDQIAATLLTHQHVGGKCLCQNLREQTTSGQHAKHVADAVIRELAESIPPIVATAIQGFAQSELAAMSYHGASKDAFEVMEKMNREALQIAKYATTHEDWNG